MKHSNINLAIPKLENHSYSHSPPHAPWPPSCRRARRRSSPAGSIPGLICRAASDGLQRRFFAFVCFVKGFVFQLNLRTDGMHGDETQSESLICPQDIQDDAPIWLIERTTSAATKMNREQWPGSTYVNVKYDVADSNFFNSSELKLNHVEPLLHALLFEVGPAKVLQS